MVITSIVVADAATGRDVAVSAQSYRVGDRPTLCQQLVCFPAAINGVEQQLQINPVTGAITPSQSGPAGRRIGPDGLRSRLKSAPGLESSTKVVLNY